MLFVCAVDADLVKNTLQKCIMAYLLDLSYGIHIYEAAVYHVSYQRVLSDI